MPNHYYKFCRHGALRLRANHDAGTKLRLSRMFINCARQNVWNCGNAAKGLTVRVGLCGKEKTHRHEEIMKKNTISFENGNRAVVITAPRDASAKAILDALEITSPRAVILLFGGAAGLDDSRKAHLETLFAEGVAPVAAELGALIIDGGTQSGVMAMMGEAVARISRDISVARHRPGRENSSSGTFRRVRQVGRYSA